MNGCSNVTLIGGKCWLAEGEDGTREMPAYWRRTPDGVWQLRRFDQWLDLPARLGLDPWQAR